jgi:hypothetical protein
MRASRASLRGRSRAIASSRAVQTLPRISLALVLAACGTHRANGGDGVPASETSAPPAPSATTPAATTFSAEYRLISKFPTCLGNRRVKIDIQGNVFAATNQTECDKGQVWSTPYPNRPVRTLGDPERQRITVAIRSSGFLGLASRSEEVDDGAIEEIDATIDGVTHTVRMDNAIAPAFQQVRQALLGAAD